MKVVKDCHHVLYKRYKYGAKHRKLSWKLSAKEFFGMITGRCFYCGQIPGKKVSRWNHGKKRVDVITYNGIDRINSKLGYFFENCVSSCWVCNQMKRDYDIDFFLRHVARISHERDLGGEYQDIFGKITP